MSSTNSDVNEIRLGQLKTVTNSMGLCLRSNPGHLLSLVEGFNTDEYDGF